MSQTYELFKQKLNTELTTPIQELLSLGEGNHLPESDGDVSIGSTNLMSSRVENVEGGL